MQFGCFSLAIAFVALSVAGDEDYSQDLLQEVYLAAMETPPREPLHLRTWATSVARNHMISMRRRYRHVFTDTLNYEREWGDDPFARCVLEEAREALAQEVLALPSYLRWPMMLRHCKGLSRSEVGKTLGIDPRVVDDCVRKARTRQKLHNGRHQSLYFQILSAKLHQAYIATLKTLRLNIFPCE